MSVVAPSKENGLLAKTGKKLKAADESKKEEMLDNLGEELRLAIWPNYDHEKFISILNEWPDLINIKSGPMQETLLHRLFLHTISALKKIRLN